MGGKGLWCAVLVEGGPREVDVISQVSFGVHLFLPGSTSVVSVAVNWYSNHIGEAPPF